MERTAGCYCGFKFLNVWRSSLVKLQPCVGIHILYICIYIIPFEHVFSTATLKLHECQGTKDPEQQKAIAKQKTNAMNSEIAGEPNPFTPWPYQIAGLPAL